jgi:putative IMPACT (imprinted ancient) family translation regulator
MTAAAGDEVLRVPATEARAETRVRGSRFLALVAPCVRPEEAEELRARARREHHDATHHVLAARPLDGPEHFDDDGEPAGTGGRPVLGAIEAAGLTGTSVVVVRWFGGTKLGTGGLARAYAEAAAAALARVRVRRVRPAAGLEIVHGWEDTGAVSRILEAHGARRVGERHAAAATIDVVVPRDRLDRLVRDLIDATSGRARAIEHTRRGVWLPDEA